MYIILTLGILESIIWVISFKLVLYSFKGTYWSTCSLTASFAPKNIKTISGFSWITSWVIFNPHLAKNYRYIAKKISLVFKCLKVFSLKSKLTLNYNLNILYWWNRFFLNKDVPEKIPNFNYIHVSYIGLLNNPHVNFIITHLILYWNHVVL